MTIVLEKRRREESVSAGEPQLSPVLVREVEASERAHAEHETPRRQETPRSERTPRPFSYD